MRLVQFAITLMLATSIASAAPATVPSAGQVLVTARAQAAAEHKTIFLIFWASW